jgi:hypothetical protein
MLLYCVFVAAWVPVLISAEDVPAGSNLWSVQPTVRPDVPEVRSAHRVASPIDAFVLERLEAEGMEMAPPADPRALIRRASFDLVGLPPSYEEIEAFAADPSQAAYETLVDRLLDSPHYGERWARHWLDVVRFADSNGYERDSHKPHVWRYRDYVIQSFNDDKPYDRFVLEQLAGDELPDRSEETVIATGMLRVGTWDDEPSEIDKYTYERLEDAVHTTSSAFLGLTVKCARCHDHRFDPIPQVEYYEFASAFYAGFIVPHGIKKSDQKGAITLGHVAGPSAEALGFDVLGWTDRGREVEPLHVLGDGEIDKPLGEARPASLSIVPGMRRVFDPPPANAKTTHRRLQLARWIVDRDNPLTPRVFVNRLWHHHFGQGIVRTPNNFGSKGTPPSHPKLLDWLASEFVDGGWKIKRLHRLILLSSTYRQASTHPSWDDYYERDSGNFLLWHFQRRRLEAELVRDAMLFAGGELDERVGGRSFFPLVSQEALEISSQRGEPWRYSPPGERNRRSLYIFTKRSLITPLMAAFDFCDTTTSCAKRDVTTVPPQALALLNNDFVHAQSDSIARRVVEIVGADRGRQVRALWKLALSRLPSESESAAALAHLDDQLAYYQTSHPTAVKAFHESIAAADARPRVGPEVVPTCGELALWLRADDGVTLDSNGRVSSWKDFSGQDHDAVQDMEAQRPVPAVNGPAGKPTLRFDGQSRALNVEGQVLSSQTFSIFALISIKRGGRVFSNSGDEIMTIFLGASLHRRLQFTGGVSEITLADGSKPLVATAISASDRAFVFQNRTRVRERGAALSTRLLDTPYMVGGGGGKFWHGDISEVIVYNEELKPAERSKIWDYFGDKYGLASASRPTRPKEPAHLALASLCHVLLNTNEFVYVD